MLASRFGLDAVVPLPLAVQGGSYEGPPRLINVSRDGLAVNGRLTRDLIAAVTTRMEQPTDMLILRGSDGASLQRIVDVTELLEKAGFTSIVLVG